MEEYGVTQQMGTQKIYDLPVSMRTPELWEAKLKDIRDNGGSFSYRAAYVRKGEEKTEYTKSLPTLHRKMIRSLSGFLRRTLPM